MAKIKTAESGFYRIPLTVALSDSTHGEIKAFELLTCRVRDSDGAEGVGYSYTVGRNGGAVADVAISSTRSLSTKGWLWRQRDRATVFVSALSGLGTATRELCK
jgi:hypothetical protein